MCFGAEHWRVVSRPGAASGSSSLGPGGTAMDRRLGAARSEDPDAAQAAPGATRQPVTSLRRSRSGRETLLGRGCAGASYGVQGDRRYDECRSAEHANAERLA